MDEQLVGVDMLTGRRVDAREALGIGLVNRVVPDATLLDDTLETVGDIVRAPREILVRTKAKIIASAQIAADLTTLDL